MQLINQHQYIISSWKFLFYISIYSVVSSSMGLDKKYHVSILTNTVENSLTALKILFQLLIHPNFPLPQSLWQPLIFYFFLFQSVIYSWNHIKCEIFETGLFHLAICIWGPSMPFCGLIAHLSLNNSPLYSYTIVYPFIY